MEINTDDRNVVEFGLARSVGRSSVAIPGVRALARSLGADRGPVDGAAVFWPGVDTAWTSFNASVGGFGNPSPETTPEERARQVALGLYFERQDMAGARESWTSQSAPARDITQLGMAADLEADAGSEAAIPLIELHRRFQPAEADVFLATLRWRQGRVEEAADALELALVRLRSDPWPLLRYKEKALALADAIARRSPALARRMFEAMRKPFAVGELHEQRLLQSADLTRQLDFATMCRPAVDAFGEHVPWSGNFLALRRDCYQSDQGSAAERRSARPERLPRRRSTAPGRRHQAPLIETRSQRATPIWKVPEYPLAVSPASETISNATPCAAAAAQNPAAKVRAALSALMKFLATSREPKRPGNRLEYARSVTMAALSSGTRFGSLEIVSPPDTGVPSARATRELRRGLTVAQSRPRP